MLHHARVAAVALLVALPAATPAVAQQATTAAQPARSDSVFTVARYLDYETVGDPQLSPDGRQIVFTRRWINQQDDRWESALWVMDADGSRQRFLAKGSSPVWSPDGKRLAYLAAGEPKGTQLWVRWMDMPDGGTQLTRLEQSPGNVRWSPDGKTLAFTAFVPARSSWKIDLPAAPQGARWTPAPRHVETLHYRADRRGFTESGYTHLFAVSAEGGTSRQLTSGEWNVGYRFDALPGGVAFDWTPDGRHIVVEGLNEPDWDVRYRDSHLYVLDVQTLALRQLTREPGTWRQPVVSPDGRRVAFSGHPANRMSYRAEELYVIGLDGSGQQKLSGDLDRDPSALQWAADGGGLYFTADDQGARNVLFADLRGRVRPVTRGAHMLSLGSVQGRTAVGVLSAPQQPGEVVRIDLRSGATTRLTRVNDGLLAGLKLGEVEEIWYSAPDGTRVQGWIVKPPAFDASRRYPLIMEIHGGPHAMYNVGFNPMFQNFAAHGYVVLYTNPRGSTGYGTAFGNAIERAYPSVDYDDLMAGIDAVAARGYVDPSRMFVGGCSGGGVLSSWVIAHTDRFAAAAVRCPVINWLSFIGQTDVPLFTQNFFDRPFWEDPEPWLKQSPLMHVGRVKTPTLLMTGELDLRTPMAQTEEYYAALKMRGVPSALLRFEGEYHGTGSRPSNWMRTQLYMMDWYQRWGGKSAAERAAN